VANSGRYLESSEALAPFLTKCVVIPLGIDVEAFDAAPDARFGKPMTLFVGRLVYYKGIEVLIEAFKTVPGTLVIVGEGPLEGRLREQAAGLAGRVRFEKVPRAASLAPYLHACDVLVLPSVARTEAFGIVLLEAMACGKPVVTTELGTGTSFICRNGETGLVVPPNDPQALAGAIRTILTDEKAAKRMGLAGRLRVEKHFTRKAMVESFVKLYESCML
jgi:glycosyltransferase involved in cell wall biosynthesis